MSLTKEDYKKIASNMRYQTQAFIDGKFCDASDNSTFDTINPLTGEVLATIAHCNQADVDKAVSIARKTFDSGVWSRCDPEHRKKVLLKLADLVDENANELAVLESLDTGKTISDCLAEIAGEAPHHIRWYAELIDKTFGKVAPTSEDKLAIVMQEPVGVAGLIVPWNFPMLMAVWKIAPSLAAGCSSIVKPAEDTPLTALRLAELIKEAGVPDGVLQVLPGYGATTGQAIGRHEDVDVISFTGSALTGGKFLSYAGETNLKAVALELGGKSPFIVLDDADITDDLIENAVNSAFWNAGQNCSANMRQIVDKSLVEEFTNRVIERTKQYVLGDPLDPNTDIGTMINKKHMEKVNSYIQSGIDEGAKMVHGGISDMDGCYVQPTIFTGVKSHMKIAREEIFGPVLGIIEVDGMEEALEVASDSEYGLHATVFTNDLDRAIYMGRRLPCGTVSINEFSEGNITTPFGGYKKSGSSLTRDNGTEAIQQYLQDKTIWISRK